MTGQSGDFIRVGNAERAEAVERLRAAAAEGRLTSDELVQRSEAALGAKTRGELNSLLADLTPLAPAVPPPVAPPPVTPAADYEAPLPPPGYHPNDPLVVMAGFDDEKRKGHWQVPPFIQVSPLAGDVKLDFLEATPSSARIEIEVTGIMGSATLVVPEGWGVNIDRLEKGLGSLHCEVARDASWGQPQIIVRGSMGLGSFKARYPNWFDKRRLGQDR